MKRGKEILSCITSSKKLLYGMLLLFSMFAWFKYVHVVEIKIPYGGYSPIGWVYKYFEPENFARDFPGGTENYEKSAFAHIYLLSYKHLGIKPETLLPMVMALEIVIIAFALCVLNRTLLPNAPQVVTALVVILFIASGAADMDLGRVRAPYLEGKVNNVANMLMLLAVTLMLKGRMVLSGILLGASFVTNPIYATLGGVFIAAALVVRPRDILSRRNLVGGLLFLLVSIGWLSTMYEPSNFTSGDIPTKVWFDLSRLNSFHWFPVDYGLFTFNHEERFIQFLSFTLLLVFYISRFKPLREIDFRVIAGVSAMTALMVIGIVFSVFDVSSAMVKLCLIRADELIITMGLIYVVNGLWGELSSGKVLRTSAGAVTLLSPFLLRPGYPLLFSLLLVAPSFASVLGGRRNAGDLFVTIFGTCCLLLLAVYAFSGIPGALTSDAYTGGSALLVLFLFGIVATYIAFFLPVLDKETVRSIVLLTMVIGFFFAAARWVIHRAPSSSYTSLAKSYKDVQLWARDNTRGDSLFMADPTIYYGWRDYSHRSSYGNLREWIYNWANSMDFWAFKEGLKRFGEFSINLDDYLRMNPPLEGFSKLHREVRNRYYSFGEDWRIDLARRYGINYFVMNRAFLSTSKQIKLFEKFKVTYMNDNFLVFTCGKQGPIFEGLFFDWNGPNIINVHDLSQTAPPLGLQGIRGDFNIRLISDKKNGKVIRIFPLRKREKGELVIQFGYSLGANGFDLELESGQEVIFIISARLYGKTKKRTQLFIQDKTETWERKKVIIDKASWDQYVVSKRIREGATRVTLGITWRPENENGWLEVKHARILIVDQGGRLPITAALDQGSPTSIEPRI